MPGTQLDRHNRQHRKILPPIMYSLVHPCHYYAYSINNYLPTAPQMHFAQSQCSGKDLKRANLTFRKKYSDEKNAENAKCIVEWIITTFLSAFMMHRHPKIPRWSDGSREKFQKKLFSKKNILKKMYRFWNFDSFSLYINDRCIEGSMHSCALKLVRRRVWDCS